MFSHNSLTSLVGVYCIAVDGQYLVQQNKIKMTLDTVYTLFISEYAGMLSSRCLMACTEPSIFPNLFVAHWWMCFRRRLFVQKNR